MNGCVFLNLKLTACIIGSSSQLTQKKNKSMLLRKWASFQLFSVAFPLHPVISPSNVNMKRHGVCFPPTWKIDGRLFVGLFFSLLFDMWMHEDVWYKTPTVARYKQLGRSEWKEAQGAGKRGRRAEERRRSLQVLLTYIYRNSILKMLDPLCWLRSSSRLCLELELLLFSL